jgi:pantetheine-phosphate adenylyltransferase
MKKAVYPGSFDPITNGHIDIIHRATKLFDNLIIAVIHNPNKSSIFSIEERIALIKDIFKDNKNISVKGYQGLLVDFARESGIYNIVRGLRALSDFDYEFQLALTNRKLEQKINTVFFMTDEKYSYLSSSLVKELAKYDANITDFVPSEVSCALKGKKIV